MSRSCDAQALPRCRRLAAPLGLLVLLCLWPVARPASGAEITTDHFAIYYESKFGTRTASEDYARLVADSLEEAYHALVSTEGFPIFADAIQVDIVDTTGGEMGAEYLAYDENDEPFPVIEIASEDSMEDVLYEGFLDLSTADLVASTALHELFHVIQDYAALTGRGDMSEMAFVEAHATAVQELLAPEVNDYLEPALDFFLAPDSIGFFHRTYDAAPFWVFVADRHGGLSVLRDVMVASASYEGRHAIDHAFAPAELAFDDLWSSFALAFATERLRDQDAIVELVDAVRQEAAWTSSPVTSTGVPSPVYAAEWHGVSLSVDRVNMDAPLADFLGTFPVDSVGASLRVAHAYGIDVIEIRPRSDRTMRVTFTGDPGTSFDVTAASRRSDGWEIAQILPDVPVSLPSDTDLELIRLIITRGDAGTGTYSIRIESTD